MVASLWPVSAEPLSGAGGLASRVEQRHTRDCLERAEQPQPAADDVEVAHALGDRIRETVLDPSTGQLDPRAEALLFAATRAQHVVAVIRPCSCAAAINSSKPVSMTVGWPDPSFSTFEDTTSTPMISCPSFTKHAAVTQPT